MINSIIRLFDLSRHLMVKNIRVFFELKLRTCQEHFQAFFKILRTPQGLAPSECSYKKQTCIITEKAHQK